MLGQKFIVRLVFVLSALTYINCFLYKSDRIKKSNIFQDVNSYHIIDSNIDLHVAPMQCYTNKCFRYLCRLLSSKVILWTELEKIEDLIGDIGTLNRRLEHQSIEHPLVLQVGGDDCNSMKQAIINSKQYSFDEINLNVGCPSVVTGGANYGASLMLKPALTRMLVETIHDNVNVPVSIKCRIGVHESLNNDGSTPMDDYEILHNFVKVTSCANIKHFIVHARSAILGGLSSSKNRSIPPLRYDYVYQLKQDFPNLKITLNGGINNFQSLLHHIAYNNNVDGFMMGRWILKRPLDLWFIDSMVANYSNPSRIVKSREEAIFVYCDYAMSQVITKSSTMTEALTPFLLIVEQLKEDYDSLSNSDLEVTGMKVGGLEEIWDIFLAIWNAVNNIISLSKSNSSDSMALASDHRYSNESPPFRKIIQAISHAIGKKVANKIKRNRSENLI